MKDVKNIGRLDIFISAALGLFALAMMLCYFDQRLNLLDEGFILYASRRVAHGQLPYRDFFTLLMPGTFCLHALLFKIFGESVLIGRYATVILGTAIPLLTYGIARQILPVFFAGAAGLMAVLWGVCYGWVLPTYSWYACAFSLASFLMFCRYAKEPVKTRYLVWTGILLGLSFLFKQTFGVYSTAAIAVSLMATGMGTVKENARKLLCILGLAVAVNLPFVVWVAIGGGLGDIIKDTLLFPLGPFHKNMGLPYPQIWPLVPGANILSDGVRREAARRAVLAIPFLYPITGLVLALSKAMENRRQMTTILLGAAFVFLAAFPRADSGHVLFTMPLGFIIASFCLSRLWNLVARHTSGSIRSGTAVLSLFLAIPLVATPLKDIADMNWAADFEISGNSKAEGIKMTWADMEKTASVLDEINGLTAPGDYVFVVPWAAMFYFLSDRQNPTRYDLIIPGNFDEAGEEEMIRDLEGKKPEYVVQGFEWDVDGKRFQDYAPRLNSYIRSQYRSMYFRGQYEFLERIGR